jgi:hypothetical protein
MAYANEIQTGPRDQLPGPWGFWQRVADFVRVVGVSGYFAVAASSLAPQTAWSSHPWFEATAAAAGIIIGIVFWLRNMHRPHPQ